MTYATALLHLDSHARMNERADFALRLARKFDSHLVGVASADRNLFELSVATGFAGTVPLAAALEDSRAAALDRARQFSDRAAAVQLESFEAVVDDRDEIDALVGRSLCADLLIVAQPDPLWPDHARARNQLEQVILHSVAPTLVLPCAGQFTDIGANVLVAWNGSPEAARAVVGAMPLLQRARKVNLVRCDTPIDAERADDLALLTLPGDWLRRHGVHVDAWIEATEIDVGNALLSRAADLGADMLVMGAWGHPRWTERMLGGATRTLLASMTVPVLMAH